jgi:protein-S-isoprenylcysteine O-methyltransferase Ste14
MNSAIYLAAWGIFTMLLLGFTLSRPHPYRIPRFLAFESILTLLFLNARVWFLDPLSVHQLLSWLFLAGSLVLAGGGFYLIKTRGNPTGDLEETTTLITTGLYSHIRHPLYGSLIAFGLGAYLKDPSLIGAALVISTFLGAQMTARIEEGHDLERFGSDYQDYMERTKRFIPFIY